MAVYTGFLLLGDDSEDIVAVTVQNAANPAAAMAQIGAWVADRCPYHLVALLDGAPESHAWCDEKVVLS